MPAYAVHCECSGAAPVGSPTGCRFVMFVQLQCMHCSAHCNIVVTCVTSLLVRSCNIRSITDPVCTAALELYTQRTYHVLSILTYPILENKDVAFTRGSRNHLNSCIYKDCKNSQQSKHERCAVHNMQQKLLSRGQKNCRLTGSQT
jgi:hypothetical protein